MRLPRLRIGRWLALGAVALAALVSIGGGATYVTLSVTTKPEFCRTCHIMEPYVDSWETSSHAHVPCVDCHYEPGLLETFEGKFKALSQLAKYITATEGTKPWAEVHDVSCMRTGCHSNRLLEGELLFGRIRFDHRHHLVGLRRGKRLRCTSCHSQIVQGNHLTVTPTTCILCHFRGSEHTTPLDDCSICHGPPQDEIDLEGFVFRHSEYLERGVDCRSCHGDVTRGTGDVPRARCGTCHNQEEHLERYEDVEFVHHHHVTDHSVDCLECHTEIEHGLPPRETHYQGDCADCHTDAHAVSSGIYRGTGGRGVADDPGVMYLARVTCTGCHRPPFTGAPAPAGGANYRADPLSCIDCHGTGFKGMVESWMSETRGHLERVQPLLEALEQAVADEDPSSVARRHYEAAAHNVGLVLLDGSEGVHNLPYVRSLLRQAVEDVREGFGALDAEVPPAFPIGPRVPSNDNCTSLCHTGIAEVELEEAFGYRFPHARHLLEAKLDCATCHAAEPHGTTILEPAGCADCHHPEADESEQCATCHQAVWDLRAREPEAGDPSPMAEFDCLTCHETIADGHSVEAMQALCDDCHEDDDEDFSAKYYGPWMEEAAAPLKAVDAALEAAPSHDAAAEVRRALRALRAAGPFHNPASTKEEAARLLERLGGGPEGD